MVYVLTILKGLLLGLCLPIPGFSISTLAVILNIYDPIIEFLSIKKDKLKKHLLTIICLAIGGIIGAIISILLLKQVIDNYPVAIGFAFMGLLIGGIPLIYKESGIKKISIIDVLYIVIGVIIIVALSLINVKTNTMEESFSFLLAIKLFITGILGSLAMIIPGISGASILLILGQYETIINALNILNLNFKIIIPTAIGCIIGVVIGSRFIGYLLNKYHKKTYLVILGLTLGSLFIIFKDFCTTFVFNLEGIIAIILLIVFTIASYLFTKIKKTR